MSTKGEKCGPKLPLYPKKSNGGVPMLLCNSCVTCPLEVWPSSGYTGGQKAPKHPSLPAPCLCGHPSVAREYTCYEHRQTDSREHRRLCLLISKADFEPRVTVLRSWGEKEPERGVAEQRQRGPQSGVQSQHAGMQRAEDPPQGLEQQAAARREPWWSPLWVTLTWKTKCG